MSGVGEYHQHTACLAPAHLIAAEIKSSLHELDYLGFHNSNLPAGLH
jgi:hypothetical protein